MEVLIWPFVGLLAFASWLLFVSFRSDIRGSGQRRTGARERRDYERRRNREQWARVAGDAARLRAGRRAKKPFVEPAITSGEITFGAEADGAARGRAAGAR